MSLTPVWLMQPIPYMGEELEGDWIVEPKVDGWRMQIIKSAGKVEFWGRRLEKNPNWTNRLAYLQRFLLHIPDGTILDSELYTDRGRRFIPSLFKKEITVKPAIYIFDVIYLNGKEVYMLPLRERKLLLQNLKIESPFFLMPFENLKTSVKEALIKAKTQGYEGIVLKDLLSPYEIGKDGPLATIYWRKAK